VISLNDAASKWMTASYPPGEILFVRSLSLIAVILLSALPTRNFRALWPVNVKAHLPRAGFYLGSSILFLMSLKLLALPVAVAISLASPLIVTAFAGAMLEETVDWRHWTAVVAGLVGVLLVTNPFDSEWGWGVVVAIAASLCIALKDIATRKLTSIESTSSIMLFSVLLLAAAGLCTAPFGWTWPTNTHMVMFVFIGLTFGLAQLLTIQAYKTAEAAIVAPMQYSMLVWSMLLGFAFWGDVPTVYSLLGSAAIVGSSAYILLTSGMPRAQQRSETKIRPQRRTLPP